MIIERVTTKSQLDFLYSESAMTFEGLVESSIADLEKWLNESGAKPVDGCRAFVTSGAVMNDIYDLTGDNAYQDDLTIVSVPLSDLENLGAVMISMRQYGGRWFDDIVDNNEYRERQKGRR